MQLAMMEDQVREESRPQSSLLESEYIAILQSHKCLGRDGHRFCKSVSNFDEFVLLAGFVASPLSMNGFRCFVVPSLHRES